MNFLPEEKRPQEVIGFMSGRLKAAAHGAGWASWRAAAGVVGDSLTCADISPVAGYLYYDEPFTFDRAAYPAIDAWLARIAATPGAGNTPTT